jgi:hypothetical protein
MLFKQRCAVAQPQSALRSDAKLLPSEAGEYADFTERAGALLKVSATGCIGPGSIRKGPLTSFLHQLLRQARKAWAIL